LSVEARKNALEFFGRYFSMEYRRVLIHGDFYPPDHVFFNAGRQELSGVIDFGDLTLEDIATDFKSIYADFGADFFRQVLAHYTGDVDDRLVARIQMRVRAQPLFDAPYALEYHQPERFERQLSAIEATFHRTYSTL
jgi:aminoglycoside 2''-phosphotransferase